MRGPQNAELAKAPVPFALRFERALDRALFLGCRTLVRRLPFSAMRALGEALGELEFRLAFRKRRRIVRELAAILGCPANDPAVRRHVREAYRTNDAAVLEILKMFDHRQDVAQLLSQVEVEGLAHLRAALAGGRGAILLGGHMGNGALLVLQLVAAGIPVSVVYREARMMDAGWLARGLPFYGIDGILATDGIQAYAKMLHTLRRAGVVYVMADQGTKKARDGTVVRFLGKDMPMPAGPAQLARHAKAPVLPVETVAARPRWAFEILPPVELGAGADLRADVQTLLQASEQVILRHPQWWSWHHRRWRDYPLATGSG